MILWVDRVGGWRVGLAAVGAIRAIRAKKALDVLLQERLPREWKLYAPVEVYLVQSSDEDRRDQRDRGTTGITGDHLTAVKVELEPHHEGVKGRFKHFSYVDLPKNRLAKTLVEAMRMHFANPREGQAEREIVHGVSN